MRSLVATLGLLVALASACRSSAPAAAPAAPPAAAVQPAADGRVEVAVTGEGFVPNRIAAKQGQPITLAITRKTDATCAREFVIKGQDGKTELPLNKTVEVTYTPKTSGEVKFGCAMGMMVSGTLAVQ